MKRKGFTLIELLAVILILGIIALIAIPTVSKLVNEAKKSSFEITLNNIEKKVSDTCSIQQLKGTAYTKEYTIDNGNISPTIDIKGNLPNGKVVVDKKCKVTYELFNTSYSGIKDTNLNKTLINKCDDKCKLRYEEIELNGATPKLDNSMIPVIIDNSGNVKKADVYSEWYKYNNNVDESKWANVVLVTNSSRETYKNAKPNTTINPVDIRAYLVWIPRFSYAIPTVSDINNPPLINIQFENKNTDKKTGDATGVNYYTHPAFTFGDTELDGIWVGKFETTVDTSSNCGSCISEDDCQTKCQNINSNELSILPNISSLRSQSIGNQFITAQKFKDYGISNNVHMMKNSEWGAVAYLSHSIYGSSNQIRINNNSSYITGCGAETEDASETSSCSIQYGKSSVYPQSTTGNITGIFDMSGGSWEYVMGNYKSVITNSGFTKLPESKYFDLYTNDTYETSCKGHANYETKGWYGDYYLDLISIYPWPLRGGYVNFNTNAGIFDTFYFSGEKHSGTSFRLVSTDE